MDELTVHVNPNPRSRVDIPFLLNVQSDLLSALATCVVVPLYRGGAAPAPLMGRLTPLLTFQGEPHVAMVPELAGIARRDLGAQVGDLAAQRPEIIAALDLLFTGI
jgi:toxin CcdB